MSPVDRGIVRRKLQLITSTLRLLEPLRGVAPGAYSADPMLRDATERRLQKIVEAAVDINTHLLVETGRPTPDDMHASFTALGELGAIDPALATALAPSAGLRNRLVHGYDRIDDAKVLAAVGEALAQFPRYVAAVERFLAGRA